MSTDGVDTWWETDTGEKVMLCDMETNHVANTLDFLKRKKLKRVMTNDMPSNLAGYYEHHIKEFQKEFDKRQEDYIEETSKKSLADIFPNNRPR